jgi:hypothetical protein
MAGERALKRHRISWRSHSIVSKLARKFSRGGAEYVRSRTAVAQLNFGNVPFEPNWGYPRHYLRFKMPLKRGGVTVKIAPIAASAALGLLIAACGLARQAELQKQREELMAKSNAIAADCDSKFPKGNQPTVLARIQCLNQALEVIRPVMPYPDLLDTYMASRLAIAERVQNKQMSVAEGNALIMQKKSDIVAEEQRRQLASRSVNAQETVAISSIMASGPHSCSKIGNTVNCY